MPKQRSLLVTFGGLGNAILLSPVYTLLAKQATVDLLVAEPLAAEYFQAAPGHGDILAWNRVGWSGIWQRRGTWQAVILGAAINPFRGSMLAWLTGAPVRAGEQGWGYTRPVPIRANLHEVERNLAIATAAGFPGTAAPVFWQPTLEGVSDLPPAFIACHPGSGNRLQGKRWPLESFAAVVQLARDAAVPVIIVGGSEETRLGAELARRGARDLTGKLTLAQTGGVLRAATVLLSNDTGLMHAAAALHTPVVALFGPTLEVKNRPWGTTHTVVNATVTCRPCYRNRPIRCRNAFRCLRQITPERVWHTLHNVYRENL